VIAPIDIECPYCQVKAGCYCGSIIGGDERNYHHAERIDAAFYASALRQNDPLALRQALSEALRRLEKYQGAPVQDALTADLSFILTTREMFDLMSTHLMGSNRPHMPRMSGNPLSLVGCSCGWRPGLGTVDVEKAFATHAALVTVRR